LSGSENACFTVISALSVTSFALQDLAHARDALLGKLGELDDLLDHLGPAGLDLRQIEDVVDQREQGAGVRLDHREIAAAVRGEPGALVADQQIAVAGDRVERRADLVREVGEETRS